MNKYLFTFDFISKTINSYIINYLKKNQTDFFYLNQGIIAADLFNTGGYYRLEVVDATDDRKEVYYCTDKKYKRKT